MGCLRQKYVGLWCLLALGIILGLVVQFAQAEGRPDYVLLTAIPEGSKKKFIRWEKTELTYAYVNGVSHFTGGLSSKNCQVTESVNSLLSRSAITPEEFHAEVEKAFNAWEEVLPIRFSYSADDTTADVLIGAQKHPRRTAFVNLRVTAQPDRPYHRLEQAVICLNPHEPWQIDVNRDIDHFIVYAVILHEIGHVVGIDHPESTSTEAVMAFAYEGRVRLTRHEKAAAYGLYGVRK